MFGFKRFYRKIRFGIDFRMDFEPFWLYFPSLGIVLEPSWGILGAYWGRPGRSWKRLRGVSARLGASWHGLGVSQGVLGARLGRWNGRQVVRDPF